MAKIDRVEDLPEWFDLEKYKGCENFGAVEWYTCLDRRQQVFAMLFDDDYIAALQAETAPEGCPAHFVEVLRDMASMMLGSIRADPLAFSHAPLSLSSLAHSLPVMRPEKASPAQMPSLTPIMVDLGASDDSLKAAFSAWLDEARLHHPKEAQPKPFYDRWARYGVLPCIDLSIWAWESGIKIPDRVMSAAISRDCMGESNFCRTVKPIVRDLLCDMSALRELASIEAAKESPPCPWELIFSGISETYDT